MGRARCTDLSARSVCLFVVVQTHSHRHTSRVAQFFCIYDEKVVAGRSASFNRLFNSVATWFMRGALKGLQRKRGTAICLVTVGWCAGEVPLNHLLDVSQFGVKCVCVLVLLGDWFIGTKELLLLLVVLSFPSITLSPLLLFHESSVVCLLPLFFFFFPSLISSLRGQWRASFVSSHLISSDLICCGGGYHCQLNYPLAAFVCSPSFFLALLTPLALN